MIFLLRVSVTVCAFLVGFACVRMFFCVLCVLEG